MLIVGLQIEKNMGQISFCHKGMKEPETLFDGNVQKTCKIPVMAYKFKGEDRWCFGESGYKSCMLGECVCIEDYIECIINGTNAEAEGKEYRAEDILDSYLKYMLGMVSEAAGGMPAGCVAVCTDLFNKRFLDTVREKLVELLPEAELVFMNKEDCYVYYALSMKEELRRNVIGLFDYDGHDLKYHKISFGISGRKTVAMVDSSNYVIDYEDIRRKDEELTEAAGVCMGKDILSAVYLTGNGFEDTDGYENFINSVCSRRRVFLGQNLYSKGACYGAYDLIYGKTFREMIIACSDRILYDIDIEILDRGVLKVYRAVKAGTNWYEAEKKVNFIVCGSGCLKFNITPVENRPPRSVSVGLDVFPRRPDRTTRIEVSLSFTDSDMLKLSIRDLGFGRFFKATDRKIEKDIRLREV